MQVSLQPAPLAEPSHVPVLVHSVAPTQKRPLGDCSAGTNVFSCTKKTKKRDRRRREPDEVVQILEFSSESECGTSETSSRVRRESLRLFAEYSVASEQPMDTDRP